MEENGPEGSPEAEFSLLRKNYSTRFPFQHSHSSLGSSLSLLAGVVCNGYYRSLGFRCCNGLSKAHLDMTV